MVNLAVSPTRFFVAASVFFGLIFALITPPFQTPDETFHFYRAYQISTFNFVPDKQKNSSLDGAYLPSSIRQTVDLTSFSPDIRFKTTEKYDWHKTFKALSIHTDQKQKQFYETSSAIYTPLMYAPQALAVLIGRIMNAPPILMMYMARLAVLATYIILFAFAIRLMPRKKWAVVAIGLIPMALFQAVALGGDTLAIGASSLLLAYILYIRDKNSQLTAKQMIAILLIASMCVLSKGITFLFLPLIWLIPNDLMPKSQSSNNIRPYLTKVFLILMPLLLYVVWIVLVKDNNIKTEAAVNGLPDTGGQLQFIIHNPVKYINTLWNTYFYFLTSNDLVGSFIGWFGYMDTPLAAWIVTTGYIGLAILLLARTTTGYDDKPKKWLTNKEKILILSLLVLYWLAINTSMYAACSNVGSKLVCGLQGRYFLPLLLPLLPVIYYGWLKITPSAYKRIAVGLPLFMLIASVLTICYRYYIGFNFS